MATKKTVSKKQVEPKKEYSLEMKFNDQVISLETDNLKESLMEIKPSILKTRVQFRIEKDGKVCDRIMPCFQAKQIFRNPTAMNVFLNRIILK